MALRTRLDLTIGRARTRTHGVACRRTHAPVNAARARTVTGFASDTDLRPARAESIGRCVVVLSHRGRVAVGAHVVPVLRRARPVELVGVGDPLIGVQMKPALATIRAGPVSYTHLTLPTSDL